MNTFTRAITESELSRPRTQRSIAGPPSTRPRVLTYSTKEVIDNRISIPAQHSLVRLSKNPATSADAVGILEEIKAGRLAGIFCVNWKTPAQRALRIGHSWWTVIPKSEDAILMMDPDNLLTGPPLIAFRRELDPDCGLLQGEKRFPASPSRVDAALLKAWASYRLLKARQLARCGTGVSVGTVIENVVPPGFCTAADPATICILRSEPTLEFEAPPPGPGPSAADAAIMARAFQDSRRTLRLAREALANLRRGLLQSGQPALTPFQRRVLISVGRWLRVPTTPDTPATRAAVAGVVLSAIQLIDLNLQVKTSAGADPPLKRINNNAINAQAQVNNPDFGVELGTPFFTPRGPNCRRDVITHEFFHLVGVGHGDIPLDQDDDRTKHVTPQQTLNSADNLAQLVSEIINGRTDACRRNGD